MAAPELEATLTLIGGPTLGIEIGGARLLTDPTFDAPGSYPSGSITLQKLAGPAMPAAALGPIDAVLLSHDQHFDNLDHAGRATLSQAGATFTTRAGAARLGAPAQGLDPWQTATLTTADGARLLVTATPARHGPVGIEPVSGDVVGFLVGLEQPGDAVYISGDTVWYDGVAEVARRYRPRLVVVFAGAARPRGPFHVTMDANDAIEAAHAFPAARLVAVHTDGWAHFSESGDDLARVFDMFGLGGRLHRLQLGIPSTLHL